MNPHSRARGVAAGCLCLLLITSIVARAELVVTGQDRKHWSYLPLQTPATPAVSNTGWAATPVDRFVLARLEEKRLAPSPPAGPRIIVRRLYFDLIGLPPTPEQVESFVQASARDPRTAIAALADELLASPHYGERWARHWLDVARYADSNGQEGDADRPTAHHYRDFIIRALNEDLPYDTFLRWQLAGDELEPENPQAIAATGFIVAGPHTVLDVPMEEEKIRNRFNELDDMVATTGAAMLGLTLGCARCHDHKYDAIPTRDYYRLLCAFNAGDRAEVPFAPLAEVRDGREAETRRRKELETARKRLDDWLKEARRIHGTAARQAKIDALNVGDDEKAILKNDADGTQAKELGKKFSKELKVEDKDIRPLLAAEQRGERDALEKAVKAAEARPPKPPLPTALAFADFAARPRDTWLLARGDFHLKTEPVELGFLTVLTPDKPAADYWAAARAGSRRSDSTQQRRALAEWMTDTEHGAGALAARVIVNRVWQHHFGEGLVRTVNDFGVRGEAPTHPELLEWLSHEFVKSGWKLKPLHRLIVTSSVYLEGAGNGDPSSIISNQSSVFSLQSSVISNRSSQASRRRDSVNKSKAAATDYWPLNTDYSALRKKAAAVDPDNRLLWRRRPQRIESEILRDAMLAVSGTLEPGMFGPAFKPPIAAEAVQARNVKDPYPQDAKDIPATRRRAIYMFHKRVVPYPLTQAFDGPDAQASCGRRDNTTVAPQALALLNDRFVRARAEDFARRLVKEAGAENEAQVRLAWRLALGREPSRNELKAGAAFVAAQVRQRSIREQGKAEAASLLLALADFCQAVFAMNEFIYVD